jgi:hypothetical protein
MLKGVGCRGTSNAVIESVIGSNKDDERSSPSWSLACVLKRRDDIDEGASA